MTQYLGLSQKEAQKNRVEYGDNLLEGGQKKSALKILLAQFGDLMTLILLCSTILSMAMGEKVEAMTIIAIVILNALMGFFQEYRTERSLQKLGELAAPSATVIRDGHSRVIPAKEVTIGDLVVLKAGDRVPADCRIVENSELSIDESLLTGEANHHHALDAKRLGLSLIAAGHYATEFPVTAAVAAALRTALPELEVLVSTENRDPYTYL